MHLFNPWLKEVCIVPQAKIGEKFKCLACEAQLCERRQTVRFRTPAFVYERILNRKPNIK